MRQNNVKKIRKLGTLKRISIGVILGGGAGFVASSIAASSGSQCIFLCNQAVAIPYFAVMGLLLAWR